MKTSLRKIGNSRGVLIPAPLLAACEIEDEVELTIEEGRLIVAPVKPARKTEKMSLMAVRLRNLLVAFAFCASLPGFLAMSMAGESAAGGEAIDVADVARRLGQRTGRPSVVLLYATTCPLSQRMFPEFVSLTKEYQRRGVDFLVYSTDEAENAYWIPVFLSKHAAGFAPVLVRPWASGSLDRALSPLGIRVGSTFTLPLVAVRDRDGRVITQGQGVTDLSGVRAALGAVTR